MSRYTHAQVRALLAQGGLSRWQVYALEHQHPLNQLCHFVGIPTLLLGVAWPIYAYLARGTIEWEVWLACQVVGWAFQLAGHRIEGNKPAFLKDPWQMAIGPLFFLAKPIAWLRGRAVADLPPPPAGAEPTAGAPG